MAWKAYNPFVRSPKDGVWPQVHLSVTRSASLRGRVEDHEGSPIAGAVIQPRIAATPVSDEHPLWGFSPPASASAADGTFRHDDLLPGATYEFRVTAVGFPDTKSPRVTVAAGEENEPLVVRLSGERGLFVRVLDDATGEPVVGASVRAAVIYAWGASPVGDEAATNQEGEARVGLLPNGRLGVYVDSPAHAHPVEAMPVPEEVEKGKEPFVVRLAKGEVIAGRVTVPPGEPVTEFRVRAFARSKEHVSRRAVRESAVAADGSFRLVGLRPFTYVLHAHRATKDGHWTAAAEDVRAPAAGVVLAPTFRPSRDPDAEWEKSELHPGRRRIRVLVRASDGARVSVPLVRVHPDQLHDVFELKDGLALVVPPHDAKTFWVEFWRDEHWNAAHGAGLYGPFDASAKEIGIVLDRGAIVRGRVKKPDGSGLAGVRVALAPVLPFAPEVERRHFEFSDAAARTDEAGRFEIVGLRPAEHHFGVAAPPSFVSPLPTRVTIPRDEIDVSLRAAVTAEVRVLDEAKRPLSDAWVRAHVPGHYTFTLSEARTDRDGIARLHGLDPSATYELSVDPETDLRSDLREHETTPWIPADVTIHLEKN